MSRTPQLNLFTKKGTGYKSKRVFVKDTAFGGAKFHSYNPNCRRPLATRVPIHLVLRSRSYEMKRFDRAIKRIIWNQCKKTGVLVKDYTNQGNHLHLVVILPSLVAWKQFIRSTTGLIARLVMRVERSSGKGVRFWSGRPWTRIVQWGRDLRGVYKYIHLNKVEALGFSRYTARVLQAFNLDGVVMKC